MVVKDIHGPIFKKMRIVWLSSGDQVGIEIFEYLDPKAERRINDNFEYWKSRFIHICITDPTLKSCVEKFQKMEEIAFCEDPFGNIIEIYTRSYEQTILSL
jgi:hypothetical protein